MDSPGPMLIDPSSVGWVKSKMQELVNGHMSCRVDLGRAPDGSALHSGVVRDSR